MFNKIAQCLVEVLPENWEDVVMFSHVEEDEYEIFFFVRVDGKYISCYDLSQYGISEDEVMTCFDEIYEILYPDYFEKKWYSATVKLNNEGDLMMFYDYNDDSKDEFEYREEWEKKYLQIENI